MAVNSIAEVIESLDAILEDCKSRKSKNGYFVT
ncbi:hypothetical protein BH20BAC1_BH20BAC1_18490 [soil metagenome]